MAPPFAAVRSRFRDILLGSYGVEYPIPEGHFHLADIRFTPDTHPPGTLERAVWVSLTGEGTPAVPTDRTSGYAYLRYQLLVQVGYVLTGAGDSGAEATGEQSGGADLDSVQDRADADRQRIASALGSWRNTGGLTPHVIDCYPEAAPALEVGQGRVTLTVPFSLLLRVPLTVA